MTSSIVGKPATSNSRASDRGLNSSRVGCLSTSQNKLQLSSLSASPRKDLETEGEFCCIFGSLKALTGHPEDSIHGILSSLSSLPSKFPTAMFQANPPTPSCPNIFPCSILHLFHIIPLHEMPSLQPHTHLRCPQGLGP